MKINYIVVSIAISASLLLQPSVGQASDDPLQDLMDQCNSNMDACNSFFGSIFATISSPVYFLAGLVSSDADLSAEPFNNMLARSFARARPEAAVFVQSNGVGEKSAVLSEALEELRKTNSSYAEMSDLQLAKVVIFGVDSPNT